MAVRTDVTVDWNVSPRIIEVAAPATEITIQDLVDTLRDFEDDWTNLSYDQIISAAGKEELGGGVQVGITATLLDALLQFEARSGPTYTQCNVSGGNLVAVDDAGVTQTTPIQPTAFTQVVVTASSSATTQNQSSLEFSSYNSGVAIDVANGTSGTTFPQGTRQSPVDNFADVETISAENGLRRVYVMNDATITTTDFSSESHVFAGDSPHIVLTVEAAADVSSCAMELLTLVGELDGLNTVRACTLGAVTNISGFIEKTALQSSMTTNGTTFMAECYSQVPGVGYPTIETGANTLMVRDYHGSLGVTGMTGGTHTIEIYGGRLTIGADCTGGTIYMRGAHFNSVNDLSGGAVTLVDQTEAKETADAIWDEAMADHLTDGTTGKTLSDAKKKAALAAALSA